MTVSLLAVYTVTAALDVISGDDNRLTGEQYKIYLQIKYIRNPLFAIQLTRLSSKYSGISHSLSKGVN